MKEEILDNSKDLEEDDFSPVILGDPEESEEILSLPETENETDALETEDLDVLEEKVISDEESEDEAHSKKKKSKKEKQPKEPMDPKKKKKIGIICASSAAALAVIYLGGAAFYSSHFYPGTTINGFNCSNLTVEKAQEKVQNDIAAYTYTLKERGGKEEVITGEELAMALESIGDFNEPKSKQNPFKWFFDSKNRHQDINILVTIDEAILDAKVASLECVKETEQDMQGTTSLITFTDGQFVVDDVKEAEAEGYRGIDLKYRNPIFPGQKMYGSPKMQKNIVSTTILTECIKEGMYALKPSLDMEAANCYVGISEESNMKQALETMNRYVSTKVNYLYGDEVIPLDYGSINLWVSVDDAYNVYLDEDAVADFVEGIAQKYDTVGQTRTFTSSAGYEATVSGGDYGWEVDVEDETIALCDIIKNGEVVDREPEYSQRANSHGSIDVGDTYVEVSIDDQHVWFYKDGSLIVSSDVVTGNPYAGNETDKGVYSLKYKERNATLVGQGYSSPVSYWMPFHDGEGLHDASWRGSFGGSIYLGGGSHGCVNCPTSTAAAIFENIDAGTPVIVY